MQIAKRKIYKHLISIRKKNVSVIDLESLGLTKKGDKTQVIKETTLNVIAYLDLDSLLRVTRLCSKGSDRILFSKDTLKTYLYDLISTTLLYHINNGEDNLFIDGEHFGSMLSSNGAKHSLTLYPKLDLPK